MKSFAIIGLGLFGAQLAKELYDAGYTVLAIDSNEQKVADIADSVTRAIVLDAKNRKSLSNLGIDNYDCVIVAITSDLATSVLVTMNLKALNVEYIVCKVQSETDREVLETLGASECLIPEHIAASKLAKRLTGRHIIDFTQLSEHHSILDMVVPEQWLGYSMKSLNIRSQYKINIIALRRDGKLSVDFDPSEEFRPGDEMIIIGNNDILDKIQKIK